MQLAKSNANETIPTAEKEKIKQIAQLETEIEAKRREISQLRIDEAGSRQAERVIEEKRGDSNEPISHSESALREDSFGEIIVLWEQPAAENQGGLKKIAIGRERRLPVTMDGSPRRSTNLNTPPDQVYYSPCVSDESSIYSTEIASNPPSPRSPAGVFENVFRPFNPSGNKLGPSSPPSRRRDIVDLLIPFSSPGSQTESVSESELLKKRINERELKIEMLEGSISSDTEVMRKMKDTIERLSIELLSAKRSEEMFKALGYRSSSLEDEIEELRVENTKLRIYSQTLEEEKRRIEEEMKTEMELLQLETGQHRVF